MFDLLKELTNVETETVVEARAQSQDVLEKYIDQEKMHSFEGGRGRRNLEQIVNVLGYHDIDEFLEDNSGCLEAIISWIGKARVPEWAEKLTNALHQRD